MQKIAKLPKNRQLTQLNLYLNSLLPQYDAVTKHKEDDWATPKEFLTIGYGDCEDYVIIKYYSLLRLGYDEQKLYLTIVKEKFHGGYHMVLSYFEKPNNSPLVFDNLSFKILPLKQRVDLQAELFINDTGVYKLDEKNSLIKVAHKYKEFEKLQKRVAKNL
jgi:predicted transglutaminase-like cysteine proteinase